MTTDRPTLSVVAPCFNEEGVLHELYRRISQVLDGSGASWELVLVNDGSRDRTPEIMRDCAALARQYGVQIHTHVAETKDEERFSASTRRTILEQVVTGQRRTSVPIHTVTRIAHTTAEGIIASATEDGYNVILLGWQGRMRPMSLGSSLGEVLDPVVKDSPCTVAVVIRMMVLPMRAANSSITGVTFPSPRYSRYRLSTLTAIRSASPQAEKSPSAMSCAASRTLSPASNRLRASRSEKAR